jgi:hypothetical protein
MYHNMVNANEKDIIANNGLLPLVTGILSKVKAQNPNHNFQVVSVGKNTVRFGTEVGLPLFALEFSKTDTDSRYAINNVGNPLSGDTLSQTISSKSPKYIINKIKNVDHIESALKMQDELFNGDKTNDMFKKKWLGKIKINPIKQLSIPTQMELIKVYLGEKQASQINEVDDYVIKELYKSNQTNVETENKFGKDVFNFMNQPRFVWYKNHTIGFVLAGKINHNVWDIPLALYKSEDEIHPEIRDPILARLTMVSMLRRKTVDNDLKCHDSNKLYPAYQYWDRQKINEIEVFDELETLIDVGMGNVTRVMMTAK